MSELVIETRSLAEIIAEDYTEEERQEIYEAMSEDEKEALQFDANFWLRPSQKIDATDDDTWEITAIICGRGWGKSLAISHWVRKKAFEHPGCRIAVAGRTAGDIRRTMVEGESGILAICPDDERPTYKSQKAALYFPNGSLVELHSSESPDSARGPQYHYAVGDEFASWKTNVDSSGATLYTNLQMATRLGNHPQLILATTPKRTVVMKDIIDRSKDPEEHIRIIRGSTLENSSLPKSFVNRMFNQFGGSDLAKQEIEGKMLEDSEGIVFTTKMLEDAKLDVDHKHLPIRIIAVDPTVSGNLDTMDECGIMALGSTAEADLTKRKAYLLEDYSLRAKPEDWIDVIIEAAKEHNTRYIVVEQNQGHELLRSVINAKDPTLKIMLVHASKGKMVRAEPVVVTMQQKRVKFMSYFPALEEQLLYYDPSNSSYSPDRMDAFVWGVTALLIDPPKGLRGGKTNVTSPNRRRLPMGLGQGRSRATGSLRRR